MSFLNSMAGVLFAVIVVSPAASIAQTKATDKVPPFALAYFVGEWAFDWSRPDSPFGPAGDVVGKESFLLVESGRAPAPVPGFPDVPASLIPKEPKSLQVIESRIEGVGPSGPMKTRAILTFDPASGKAARYEIDQSGTILAKEGAITGDLGGIYSFNWEAETLQRGGQRVRLRGRTVAYSPRNFRDFVQYSVNGDEFVAYGQPWYRKSD